MKDKNKGYSRVSEKNKDKKKTTRVKIMLKGERKEQRRSGREKK